MSVRFEYAGPMMKKPFGWQRPMLATLGIACAVALGPSTVHAGGDAPDPCAERLRFAGEATTYSEGAAPTELVVNAAAGAAPVNFRIGRVSLLGEGRPRRLTVRTVTDDDGVRQPRVLHLEGGESKRLHLAVRIPAGQERFVFTIEASAGTCRYSADAQVRRVPAAESP